MSIHPLFLEGQIVVELKNDQHYLSGSEIIDGEEIIFYLVDGNGNSLYTDIGEDYINIKGSESHQLDVNKLSIGSSLNVFGREFKYSIFNENN